MNNHIPRTHDLTTEEALEAALIASTLDREPLEETLALEAEDDSLHIEDATSFEDSEVLTMNRGVVLTLSDGTKWQLTIVRAA